MTNRTRTRTHPREAFLGVLACACFLLSQFAIPVHLVLDEHTFGIGTSAGEATASHAHAEDGFHRHGIGHDHPAPQPSESDGGHAPHPIEDHLQELGDSAVRTSFAHSALPLEPAVSGYLDLVLCPRGRILEKEQRHRPPPPRTGTGPRAPPVVV